MDTAVLSVDGDQVRATVVCVGTPLRLVGTLGAVVSGMTLVVKLKSADVARFSAASALFTL